MGVDPSSSVQPVVIVEPEKNDDLSSPPLTTLGDDIPPLRLSPNDPLVAFVNKAQEPLRGHSPRLVIVVYASFSYLEPLVNWLVALNRLPGDNNELLGRVLIICLDQELKTYLQTTMLVECFLLQDDVLLEENTMEQRADSKRLTVEAVSNLWVVRTRQVLRLLLGGFDVVISDTDAIWLKNPLPTLYEVGGDIVGGRGFFPFNPPRGTTLCMGFVFIKCSNPHLLALVQQALRYTSQVGDDQIGFDMAFTELEKTSTTTIWPAAKRLDPRGARTVHGTFGGITLVFLSASLVPRDCSRLDPLIWKQETLVAHCHMHNGQPARTMKEKGNQKSHTDVLKTFGLYFLSEAWRDRVVIGGQGGLKEALKEAKNEF